MDDYTIVFRYVQEGIQKDQQLADTLAESRRLVEDCKQVDELSRFAAELDNETHYSLFTRS